MANARLWVTFRVILGALLEICINFSLVLKIVKQGPSQKVISHHEPTPGNEGVSYEQAQTTDVRPNSRLLCKGHLVDRVLHSVRRRLSIRQKSGTAKLHLE